MPGKVPDKVGLYRIVHIDNLEYILINGMHSRDHARFDPNYISIGNAPLIQERHSYPIGLPDKGTLGQFVPFYFGPLSVMLLNITTGFSGVAKRPQSDIVYVCCTLESLESKGLSFVFTDGHAKDKMTCFFEDKSDLDKVDWNLVGERYWRNTKLDTDRQRRKQAEFLVFDHVPVECINAIVVYNQETFDLVASLQHTLGVQIPIYINPNSRFYY